MLSSDMNSHFFMCWNRSDGLMRTMNTEKLLKTIPIIQNQMDVLLDFNVSVALTLSLYMFV